MENAMWRPAKVQEKKYLRSLRWRSAHYNRLMPFTAAGEAFWFMDADYPAAVRAGPSLPFAFDEFPYAGLFDVLEIVDHAHAVLCSVALV